MTTGETMTPRKHVEIWVDGACVGNPGPGGYAAVLLHGEHRREITGGYRLTTNNRMELRAVIAALEALRFPCTVTVHSDARYVVDGVMTGAMRRWRAFGWRRGHDRVPNADLWAELHTLCEKHEVTLRWVRGHTGIPGNERCDLLASGAALAPDLPIDVGYESRPSSDKDQPGLFDALAE